MNTKELILKAALATARKDGLYAMTRDDVAKAAKVAMGSVNFHYTTMGELRRAVIRHAIAKHQYLDVLAEALVARDTLAVRAPAGLKREAIATLSA